MYVLVINKNLNCLLYYQAYITLLCIHLTLEISFYKLNSLKNTKRLKRETEKSQLN